MNKEQLINRHARNLNSLVGTGLAQDECQDIIKYAVNEALTLYGVGCSCVDKETLISDLDDKRIVGVTLNEDMWHYCRKETAEHLLDKYEIIPK